MFKSLTTTFVKYKIAVLVGGFLVVIVVGVFIFSRVSANTKVDVQINIKPTLTLGPCFNNQTPPKTTIVTPVNNTKYTVGDKVPLSGLAVLGCDNSKIEDKNIAWYLDSDSSPFALGLTYSLEGLKAGEHKIRLVALSGKLKGESTITIKFEDPKPQVLGTRSPPPAPPTEAPNQAPTVQITEPRSLIEFLIDDIWDSLRILPVRTLNFVGSATDPEDGQLTGNKLEWYKNGELIGTGERLFEIEFTTNKCKKVEYEITLKATDSKGLSSTVKTIVRFEHFNQVDCLLSGGERIIDLPNQIL